jgi:hypothetical protein
MATFPGRPVKSTLSNGLAEFWTVHDGFVFSRSSQQAARTPESRRLIHETMRRCQRAGRRRRPTSERSSPPEGDGIEAASTDGWLFASVQRLLRNFWLLDGLPSATLCGSHCKAPRACDEPSRLASTTNLLPPSVVAGLYNQHLHVLEGWLNLSARHVHATDDKGTTALHFAVMHPFNAAIELLIERGADVNARLTTTLSTPLLITTMRRPYDLATIGRLLRAGADVDLPDDRGHSALMTASRAGWTDTVRVLVEAGASLEARDNEGHHAHFYARVHKQHGTALYLRGAMRGAKAQKQGV